MKKMTDMCQQWIQGIGKEKIQALQDSLAEAMDISLCLLLPDGRPVTVWSNSSLFCHAMIENHYERCLKERQRIIGQLLKKKSVAVFYCYVGRAIFACPVFYRHDMVAFFLGGAERGQAGLPEEVNGEKIRKTVKLLENICELMNFPEQAFLGRPGAGGDFALLNSKLSRREIEIVKLINKGLSNMEIAENLYISEKTAKTHVTNILRKLEMKDRLKIILFCKENNIS